MDSQELVSNVWDVIIPTKGERIEQLANCLESIKQIPVPKNIIIVSRTDLPENIRRSFQINKIFIEKNLSLPESINFGLAKCTGEYFSWLSDDDYYSKSFTNLIEVLRDRPQIGMVYGGCNYVKSNGQLIATNSAKKYALFLAKFGPNLISQPSTLFRRSYVELIGGCDSQFNFAFDQDLILRVSKNSTILSVKTVVSSYTYHAGTLTNKNRKMSIQESFYVKWKNGNIYYKILNVLIYPLTVIILYAATTVMNFKSR